MADAQRSGAWAESNANPPRKKDNSPKHPPRSRLLLSTGVSRLRYIAVVWFLWAVESKIEERQSVTREHRVVWPKRNL